MPEDNHGIQGVIVQMRTNALSGLGPRSLSLSREAGSERRVACELAAVALGPVATKIADVAPGAQIRCTGFLARRYRTGITVALHVNEYDLKSETKEGN